MLSYRKFVPDTQPERRYDAYRSTILRNPRQPLVEIPQTLSEVTGPLFGHNPIGETDHDLTKHFPEEPQGQRINLSGQVLDEDGRPVPHTLVEIWQANAGGRYRHPVDNHPSPIDPNFNSIPDVAARQRLISRFDMETTEPEWVLGFKWDIVLRGRCATPFEERE